MRIYFTASLTGKEKYEDNYRLIVKTLKRLGHEVIADQVFNASAEGVRKEPLESRLKYLKYLNSWLTKCDLLIAETSFPSTSIGFEVCVALNRNKPVLVLYTSQLGYAPVLAGLDGEKLLMEEYNNKSLEKVLKDSLKLIAANKDQRFTMLLSPDILDYLDKVASGGTNKSEYIRKLIKKEMKK